MSFARRGTFATRVDITELGAISELRVALEPLAARNAATGASDDARAQLSRTARTIEALPGDGDRHDLMRFDIEVHRMIYRAAGNAYLEESLVRLDNLATRIWCLVLDRLPGVGEHIREHVDLLDAIAAGEADRAARLAVDHVTHFERIVRDCL